MAKFFPKKCKSFHAGHGIHYIQVRIMREKPRFDAKVELVSDFAIRITTSEQDEILFNHDAAGVFRYIKREKCSVQYSPESRLLYMGFSPIAYFAQDEIRDCIKVTKKSLAQLGKR